MKKIAIVCVFAMTAALVCADAELDMYTFLYDGSQTQSEQLAILQSMAEANVSGAGDFYAKALTRLVAGYSNIRTATVTERSAASEQAKLRAGFVGTEKNTASARDLWRIYTDFPQNEALAKAEALMALGKIQAKEYFPQVNEVLKVLNGEGKPPADPLNGERIAYGAIIALEKFQNPEASLQLYKASNGWYTDRVKSQAARSLDVISATLAPYISGIIKSAGSTYQDKLTALQTIQKSKAVNDDKSAVAVVALAQGWTAVTRNPTEQNTLATMRRTAIDMIRGYGSSDASIYPLLERSYSDGLAGEDEKFRTVRALSVLATDDSARLLAQFLSELNIKRQRGNITQDDERMVREIIPALGATKRPSGRFALTAVINNDGWTPAVKTLARNALNQMPAN
ncbi:MAG: hypothetical protein LBD48_10430 [Treponema sp.]|jgi:hypothetical protein|nr:hypothetical protein [Treponema sp.]